MASFVNNSYVFGLVSGALIQQFIKSNLDKEVPLSLTIPASMITHRMIQSIPKLISSFVKSVEARSELIDRTLADLTVPTTSAAITTSHFLNSESHFIDLAAKVAALFALNSTVIHPAIVYISPTKRFFDTLNHPFTQKTNSAIGHLIQSTLDHPMLQLGQFITKLSFATVLTESLAEPIQNYIPFESYKLPVCQAFAALTFGSFFTSDFFSFPGQEISIKSTSTEKVSFKKF